jgi:hypothetical protein
MQESTGKILSEEKLKKLSQEEQKTYRKLENEEYQEVKGMNRAERRAWAKKNPRRNVSPDETATNAED